MISPLIAALPPARLLASVGAVICAALTALIIASAWSRIAKTTLTGPWCWSLAALGAIGAIEGLIAGGAIRQTAEAWRFAAAVGVFSPWMSLIGAKRPQDQPWHFIIASLWAIQALPAAEALFLRPGQPLAIIDFRAFFLMLLIGLSLLIHLPTRFWLAALLAAAGQLLLLWSYLPFDTHPPTAFQVVGATVFFLAAALVALLLVRRPPTAQAFDRLWRDFRDSFGALWAARVMERVNASATMYQWPVRLTWSGFRAAEDLSRVAEIPPSIAQDVQRVLINLLRRFVSHAWIEQRLQQPVSTSV